MTESMIKPTEAELAELAGLLRRWAKPGVLAGLAHARQSVALGGSHPAVVRVRAILTRYPQLQGIPASRVGWACVTATF